MCWESISDMFAAVDKEDYLVLRNYKNIANVLGTNNDIDILCNDMKSLTDKLGAVCISDYRPCFNYYVVVDHKKLLLDIRMVGDGYYDSNWEKRMLEEKIVFNDFYILDAENYKYSLLYHIMIQKKESATGKYKKQIEDLFELDIEDRENCCEFLLKFLKNKGYQCTEPLDHGVYINYPTFNYINSQINKIDV